MARPRIVLGLFFIASWASPFSIILTTLMSSAGLVLASLGQFVNFSYTSL